MQDSGSLKQKTMSGIFWSFFDIFAKQGLNFIIQIVLARLLMPKDFGIIGMIIVFINLSQIIVNSGFSNALIREKEVGQEEYSTVFFFNIAMALTMYLVLFLSAGAISRFFNESQLILILRVLGIVLIFDSISLIQITVLTRKVNFKTQSKISIISAIISGTCGITMAYLGYGVWSLVIRTLMMQFTQALLLCFIIKWRPVLVFKWAAFKRLFNFGWKLLVSGLLSTLYGNVYYLIIGRMFSAIELGYYTNTQKLIDTVIQSTTSAINRVSYPVLSSIKEDQDRLKQGYRRIIKNALFITFPIMFGLAATADSLILSLFGEKWLPSVIYFRIICLSVMLYPLDAFNLNILQVKGRSDLFLRLSIIKKIIGLTVIGLVIYFQLGIIGLLWAAVLDSYICYFINSYYSARLLSYSTKEQVRDIQPIFLISLLMSVVVYFSGLYLPFANMINLLCQIIIGFLIYFGMCRIVGIEELKTINDFTKLLKKAVPRKNRKRKRQRRIVFDLSQRIKRVFREEGFRGIVLKLRTSLSIGGWRKDLRFFNRLFKFRAWKKAIKTGETLLEYNPIDPEFRRKLAICYWYAQQYGPARKNMRVALELKLKSKQELERITQSIQLAIVLNPFALELKLKSRRELERIIQSIRQAIALNPDKIKSEYLYLGGEINLGFIEHIYPVQEGDKRYLTKIIAGKAAIAKEKRFYTEICQRHSLLREITPELIDIIDLPVRGLCFITFSKIKGRAPSAGEFREIIRIVKLMETVRYAGVIDLLPADKTIKKNCLGDHPGLPFVKFNGIFATIHQEQSNREVFRWLKGRIEQLSCSPEVCQLIRKLEYIILNLKIYQKIVPNEQYVFLHNDFHKSNILLEDSSKRFYIIDWEKYGVGPAGYDLIRFFQDYDLTFNEIREVYLQDLAETNQLDLLNQLFFVYPLIISYFTEPIGKGLDKLSEDYVKPAVEYIEYLTVRIKQLSR